MRPELYDAVMTNPQRFAQLMQQEFGRRVELEQERKQQEAVSLSFADAYFLGAPLAHAYLSVLTCDSY